MNYKQLRIKKNLTQSELARLVGVSVNTIRSWENLNSKPEEENLSKLLEVLKNDD